MHIIPIIFATDNNAVMPCGVAITSLLINASFDTFYDIYIIYNTKKLSLTDIDKLKSISLVNSNCKITCIEVESRFQNISIIGHVTVESYFRILIPELFPQYDKVIYVDIDMIFQKDLYDVYNSAIQKDELIAAVLDLAIIKDVYAIESKLPQMIGSNVYDYINAGFLIMNLNLLRNENVKVEFDKHLKLKYNQNDQDVINVVCKNRIEILPQIYNFQLNHFINYYWNKKDGDNCPTFQNLFETGTLHYTGKDKPWNSLNCLCADTWWHYYKRSIFYNDFFYIKYQQSIDDAIRRDIKNASTKSIIVQLLSRIKRTIVNKK